MNEIGCETFAWPKLQKESNGYKAWGLNTDLISPSLPEQNAGSVPVKTTTGRYLVVLQGRSTTPYSSSTSDTEYPVLLATCH